jgi:hypothetical protein
MTDDDQRVVQGSSAVDNRGATYSNVHDVYNGPVTKQTIVKDNAVTYNVNQEDVKGLEKFSMFVMEAIGEKKAKITAAVTIALGGGGIFSIASPAINVPTNFTTPLLYIAIGLLFVGAGLVAALQFKANSRCVTCNQFYAMQEHGEHRVREARRHGGTQRTTTRFYKCRHCGAESGKTDNEFIEDNDDEE